MKNQLVVGFLLCKLLSTSRKKDICDEIAWDMHKGNCFVHGTRLSCLLKAKTTFCRGSTPLCYVTEQRRHRFINTNYRIQTQRKSVIPVGEPESKLTGCQGRWTYHLFPLPELITFTPQSTTVLTAHFLVSTEYYSHS